MKRIAFLLLLPLAFACKTQKIAVEEQNTAPQPGNGSIEINTDAEEGSATDVDANNSDTKPPKPYRLKAALGDVSGKSDFYTIISAEIEGNLLMMTVEYSGGCARHSFEFIGSTAVSKSLPPQRSVKLMHDNGDDMCESIVQQNIEIDITELAYKQQSGSEIILNLEGYDEPLKFVFP